jgi:hypothetical protein
MEGPRPDAEEISFVERCVIVGWESDAVEVGAVLGPDVTDEPSAAADEDLDVLS